MRGMDYIEIKRAVFGIAIAAFSISRFVRLMNGAKFDSIFQLTKTEWAVVIVIILADMIHGAIEDVTLRIVLAAFASIVVFGFIGKHIQSKKPVKPPATHPDAPAESN